MGFFRKRKPDAADSVFLNGRVYTRELEEGFAQAVAVKDGYVMAVGDNEDISALVGDDTYTVDLDGATVIPGLIDLRSVAATVVYREVFEKLAAGEKLEEIMVNLDGAKIQELALDLAWTYAKHGFTAMASSGNMLFFENAYQQVLSDLIQAGLPKQRYFSAIMMNRDIDPDNFVRALMQCKVNCVEMDGYIESDILCLRLNRSPDAPALFTEDCFRDICMGAAEHGISLHLETVGKEALLETLDVIYDLRRAYGRANIVLFHEDELSEDELPETFDAGDFKDVKSLRRSTADSFFPDPAAFATTEEFIDALTIDAALLLERSEDIGSIESDKRADFAIYKQDVFALSPADFAKTEAAMTVLAGEIVYDKENSTREEWSEKLAEYNAEFADFGTEIVFETEEGEEGEA